MGPRQVELQAEEWSEAVGEEAEEEVSTRGVTVQFVSPF